jgi:hypothetical protein
MEILVMIRFEDFIVMLMQHSGMSAKGEPRNVVSGQIPRPLLRDRTQEDRVRRAVQGAIPDVAYTDPGDGKKKIVELKFINQMPNKVRSRCGDKPTYRCEQA